MGDKKILVFYVGVGDMPDEEVGRYIDRVKQVFFTQEFSARIDAEMILLPVREMNSRIECINPKYITDKALIDEHEELMEEYLKSLDKFIKDQQSNG